jgi:hypothetical protein
MAEIARLMTPDPSGPSRGHASSASQQRWPDLYIVGAPRTGTGFLWRGLLSHPGVFMSRPKEPLYFCSDLDTGTAADDRSFIRDARTYLSLFEAASTDALLGEACVYNLFSTVAAAAIQRVQPAARLIISLREPIAQMISFHGIRRGEGQEDLPFADAIAAQPERLVGRRLPRHAVIVPAYQYRAVASYAAQVARYLEVFPRDQVLILFYEDLQKDATAWLTSTLDFLGLPPAGAVVPGVVNRHWATRWPWLAGAMRSERVLAASKRVVPRRLHPIGRNWAVRLVRANRQVAPVTQIDPRLRAELRAELADDVARLEHLLDIDLSDRWGSYRT